MITARGNTFFELLLALFLIMTLQWSFSKTMTTLFNATSTSYLAYRATHLLHAFLQKTNYEWDEAVEHFSLLDEEVKAELPGAYAALNDSNTTISIRWGLTENAPCLMDASSLKGCVEELL